MRIKDVARVELGANSSDRYCRFNGAPTAAIGIYNRRAPTPSRSPRRCARPWKRWRQRFPDDLAYTVFFDTTVFVTATIEEVVRTLVEAFVLVGIVVFLFLGKLRTTLIPLIAVPVSIIGAFAVHAGDRLFRQHGVAAGAGAGDRHRGRRRDRGHRERRAGRRGGARATVPEATKKAMAEITGPIIAITLVLLSVFVPVAFIPGISGQLFRQFAVAVSISMLISALNALTLSPALCSVLLKRGQSSRGPMRYVLGAIDRARDGYGWVVNASGARLLYRRHRRRSASSSASGLLFRRTPQSFLPEEDQGAIFAAMRLPEGASINRTGDVVEQVEDIIKADARRRRRIVGGRLRLHRLRRRPPIRPFSSSVSSPTSSARIRRESATRSSPTCVRNSAAIQQAVVFPFNLPPILGLGNTGGFQYMLEALQGQPPAEIAAVMRGLLVSANQQPELAGVFSTFRRRYAAGLSRHRSQQGPGLGVRSAIMFNALQSTIGRFYVNNFNLFGRIWQVNLQAETPFRREIDDIFNVYVRSASGAMVPVRVLGEPQIVQGPQLVVRYNDYRAALINGAARSRASAPARRLAAMERVSASTLPPGYTFEWTGTALQEKAAAGGHVGRAGARHSLRLSVPRRAL